jgi:hypothetical protein
MRRCSCIKADGQPCKGVPIKGSEWCPAHHPDYVEARREHGRRGGRRAGRGRPLAELHALKAENEDLRQRMIRGELEPRVVSICVQSINVGARLIEVALKAREQQELEQRMTALEEALGMRSAGSQRRGA